MKGRKATGLGLLVAAAAMMAMAFAASSASATEVTPANETVTANLIAQQPGGAVQSRFIPKNAFSNTFVACAEASSTFTTPPSTTQAEGGMEQNRNTVGVGTRSQGSGSVIAQIEGEPTFASCTVREFTTENNQEAGTVVFGTSAATVTTTTGWSIAAWNTEEGGPWTAVGVPNAGAVIEWNAGIFSCTVTIGAGSQSVVMGDFTTGAANENSTVRFDGQVKYTSTGFACGNATNANSPAQYEARYVLVPAEGAPRPVEINP